MPISKRQFIAGAGATSLALFGGAGFWKVARRPHTATLPWTLQAPAPSDVRLDAFRYAILAPNPHNRQPWLIRMEGDDGAVIWCDLDRRLPDTDPFDRQITIGFGTFLELARMAAAERGFRLEVEPFPDGEPQPRLDHRPVARLSFVSDAQIAKDPLFAAITQRRTNRAIYDPERIVSEAIARQIGGGASAVDAGTIAAVRSITVAAITTEITTPHTFGESVDLMRIGADQVDANPDGLILAGPKMEALKLIGLLDRAALANPSSTAFKTGLDMQREICCSIPALIWITTPGNTRIEQLEAGRRYVRANLRATQAGLAMHPLSQSLQEYPEMKHAFADIHRTLGAKTGERVQMLARMGYASAIDPAPRWPLETHLRS